MANGRPRGAFYVVLLLVVAGLVYLGVHRYGGKQGGLGSLINPSETSHTEASDTSTVTTAKEYTYVPAQRLPPVRGISNYKPLTNRTVRMALNVWAGWAPVIVANNGFKAAKVWKAPGGKTNRRGRRGRRSGPSRHGPGAGAEAPAAPGAPAPAAPATPPLPPSVQSVQHVLDYLLNYFQPARQASLPYHCAPVPPVVQSQRDHHVQGSEGRADPVIRG